MLNTLIILFCALLIIIIFRYLSRKYLWEPYQVFKEVGISGPEPQPFFGNSKLRFKLGLLKFISLLREKYGPIFGFYIGPLPQLVIFDVDILKQILIKDFDTFTDRPPFPDILRKKSNKPRGLLTARGHVWKVNRQTLSPTFSAAKMKMMVPLIEKSVAGLLKRLGEIAESEDSADIFRVFGAFTMDTIMATAFGRQTNIQGGESDVLTQYADLIFRSSVEGKATSLQSMLPIISNFPWIVPILRFFVSRSGRGQAVESFENIALDLIKARRKSGQQGKHKDLLQLMIDASDQEKGDGNIHSSEQMVANSMTFFLAGYETTANTLAYTAYLLALNPHIQERLQREIDDYMEANPDVNLYEASQEINYLDMVVHESLRLFPPAHSTQRYCSKTTVINGLTIPEKTSVLIPISHLHKDPQHWEDPEVFNPERFTAEEKGKRSQFCYMPFGAGPRNCIGMRFALLEAKIALLEVLRKYSFVKSPLTEVPLQTSVGITMSPTNGIHLKTSLRQ